MAAASCWRTRLRSWVRPFPRTRLLATVLLVAALAHGGVLASRGLLPGRLEATSQGGGLTVLTFNTARDGVDPGPLADLAVRTGAQVLVLPETTQARGERLASRLQERGRGRFAVFSAFGDSAGFLNQGDPAGSTTVLVSSALGEYRQGGGLPGAGMGAVRLVPVDGEGPVIVGVHPYAPVPGLMEQWRSTVGNVLRLCAAPEPGLILAGDLNSTRDHALLRDLGGCAEAGEQAGVGGLATWPTATGTPLLGATIDHVLVDGGAWRGREGEVVTLPGSDHRAVVVHLEAL